MRAEPRWATRTDQLRSVTLITNINCAYTYNNIMINRLVHNAARSVITSGDPGSHSCSPQAEGPETPAVR